MLTETHHAVLFALLARLAIARFGSDRGEPALLQAVRRYGEQRGRRMALRVLADGLEPDMLNYLVYGEWLATDPQPGASELVAEQPAARLHAIRWIVYACPWNSAWLENDLLPYGRLYCLEIDRALVRGYNPTLRIDILSTLTGAVRPSGPERESPTSDFRFYTGPLSADALSQIQEQRAAILDRVVMPWDYHCGHLYQTCARVLADEFGPEGQAAAQTALDEFAARYGPDAAQLVLGYLDTDFDRLPS